MNFTTSENPKLARLIEGSDPRVSPGVHAATRCVDTALATQTGASGMHRRAAIDVNFSNVPKGTKVGTESSGIFKDVSMKTTPQMPMAGQGEGSSGWGAAP